MQQGNSCLIYILYTIDVLKFPLQMIAFYIFHGPLQLQKLEDSGKCHIKVLVICNHFPACTAITYMH